MRNRTYPVNTDFFKTWNSKVAYILGFVLSDGAVDDKTLPFELRIQDGKILKKIRTAMNSTHSIRVSKKRNSTRLKIHSSSIVHQLKQLGLAPSEQMVLPPCLLLTSDILQEDF